MYLKWVFPGVVETIADKLYSAAHHTIAARTKFLITGKTD